MLFFFSDKWHWVTVVASLVDGWYEFIRNFINNRAISGSQVEYFGLLCLNIYLHIFCSRIAVLDSLGCGVDNDDLAKKFPLYITALTKLEDKSNVPFLQVLPSRVSVKITKNLLPHGRKTYFNCIRLNIGCKGYHVQKATCLTLIDISSY